MKCTFEVGDKVWYDDAGSGMPWYPNPVKAKVTEVSFDGRMVVKIKKNHRRPEIDNDGLWYLPSDGYRITPRD